jgi:hypothetical protein
LNHGFIVLPFVILIPPCNSSRHVDILDPFHVCTPCFWPIGCIKHVVLVLMDWTPMNLESFHYVIRVLIIHKALVNNILLKILKFEHVFCYSNLHQMFTNLLWALIYFIEGLHVFIFFECTCIESF